MWLAPGLEGSQEGPSAYLFFALPCLAVASALPGKDQIPCEFLSNSLTEGSRWHLQAGQRVGLREAATVGARFSHLHGEITVTASLG